MAKLSQSGPQSAAYNRRQIAWELERTAMGDGYFGNALRVAKDLPEATSEIRSLLDRWATGKQRGFSDRISLCAFALKVDAASASPPTRAPVGAFYVCPTCKGAGGRYERDARRPRPAARSRG